VAQDDRTQGPQETSDAQSFAALESALAHHAQGDFSRAVELYGAISPHSPSFQEGQYYLGVALHHLGQHQRAVELLHAALAASGGRVDWANKFGNILTAQNRFAEAADIFEQAIEKAPTQALLQINLGAARERLGDFAKAEKAYQAAIALEPDTQEAYRLLSALYAGQKMELESVRAYCAGYIVSPRETTTPYLLGKAFYVLGRLDEAAEVYRRWREAEPDNPVPAHLFAACSSQDDGDVIPDRCSDDYVNVTFDDYASHFEGKLSSLDYRGPELLKRLMETHFEGQTGLHVLDAGCGTGLCAPMLRPVARSLVGVDLSGAMLDLAAQRDLYEALHKAEIGAFLDAGAERPFDLIACMDTLIYFGAIEPVFRQFAENLTPGGWLIFTSEICADNSKIYQLNPSGRYSHSVAYLRKTMEEAGFHCAVLDHEPLRTELQKPVAGVIVLARRL
jgi:tetratricopeptide (TPR) repeat protein